MAQQTLNVFLGEVLVGELKQDSAGVMRFQYISSWLDSLEAEPLSASLPLRSKRFSRKETRPFFAGVLPEEESRRLIARAFGISANNDFALLARIGAECAGAVSLLSSGELPSEGRPSYQEISEEGLAERLRQLSQRPLLVGEKGIRLSLAGAQHNLDQTCCASLTRWFSMSSLVTVMPTEKIFHCCESRALSGWRHFMI